MIRVSSLDFLNREFFDIDLMSKDGTILFSAGDKITPEILLHLYFKEIYVAEDMYELEEAQNERLLAQESQQEQEMIRQLEELEFSGEQEDVEVAESPQELSSEIVTENEESLEFDEAQAKRVSQYALMLAESIYMSQEQQKDIEKAAYYLKVGIKRLTKTDLSGADYKRKLAQASYDTMKNELSFSEKISEVAKFYMKGYDSSSFKLNVKLRSNIPYAHIVSIASCYDELSEKMSSEEALEKMLQMGGNKFNIFVLHKFINLMRK